MMARRRIVGNVFEKKYKIVGGKILETAVLHYKIFSNFPGQIKYISSKGEFYIQNEL